MAETGGLPFHWIDLAVIGILLASGLLALFRGFTREALMIVGWIAAFSAAGYGMPYALPYTSEFISDPGIAEIVAAAIVFVGTLLLFTLITMPLTALIRRSSLSALDRSLGFAFGLGRGILFICAAFLAFLIFAKEDRQEEITASVAEARSGGLIILGADGLTRLLPDAATAGFQLDDLIERARESQGARPDLTEVRPAGETAEAESREAGEGYAAEERDAFEALIDQTQ